MARDLAAQSHRVSYGDEKYMDCTSKSFYIHCSAKRDLPDGKWIFTYPGAKSLAMVVFISDGNWNGMQYRYREDGSLSVIETYKNGSTPNPCAICNNKIKWGKIFDFAINELNCDYFATGHYANITDNNGVYRLERAKCDNKDQLYFLYSLTQKELSKTKDIHHFQ